MVTVQIGKKTVRHREQGTPFDKATKELSPELRSKVLSVLSKIKEIKYVSCSNKRKELARQFKNAVAEICREKGNAALDRFCTLVGKLAVDATKSQDGLFAAFRGIRRDIMEDKLISAFDELLDFEARVHRTNGGGKPGKNRKGMGRLPLTDDQLEKLPEKEKQDIAD